MVLSFMSICVLTINIHSSILNKDIFMNFSIQMYLTIVYIVYNFQNDTIIHFKMEATKLLNLENFL